MFKYQILERFLREDIQERTPLQATRLVIHSTANPGATDEGHFSWLDQERQHGWAHFYADWNSISQLVPEGFVAPAQGSTANRDSISIEMCEPSTKLSWAERLDQFNKVWDRTVWLAADILYRYGWDTRALYNHAMISQLYPNDTDHTDPIAFFQTYNKTWNDFVSAVSNTLLGFGKAPEPAAWQTAYVTRALADKRLTTARHPLDPVTWWELLDAEEKILARVQQMINGSAKI
jgi:hypothetical protein